MKPIGSYWPISSAGDLASSTSLQRFQLVIPSGVEGSHKNTMTYYVYMLTNRSRVVLYIGVTNSLEGRLWHHSNTHSNSFVKRYKLDRLVYYELYEDIRDAISREKQLKTWRREKKNDLVHRLNPKWEDLGVRMFGARR